jgi:hypothetical protein
LGSNDYKPTSPSKNPGTQPIHSIHEKLGCNPEMSTLKKPFQNATFGNENGKKEYASN